MNKIKDLILKVFHLIPLSRQIKVYLICGSLATGAYILSANLFMYLFNNSLLSGAGAFLIGWMVSYWGHLLFTFQVQEKKHTIFLTKDVIRNLIVFGVTQFIIYILFDIYGLNFAVVSFLAALAPPVVSYPLMKYWVFK